MAWSQQSGLEHNVDYNHTQFTDTHHDHDTNYNYEHHDTEGTYPDHYNETRRTAQHGYLYQEQRHEQQPRGDEQKRRPRRNARARREQYRRAEIRHIEHILKCYDALNHRGNHVSRLGHSIRRALQHEQHTTRQQQERYQPEDDEQPRLRRNRNDNSDEHHVTTAHEQNTRRINNDDEKTPNRTTRSLMPTCKHHLRGTCTFGKYCKFSHESSNEHYDSKTQQHDYDNDRSTDKQEHKEVEYCNLNYNEEVDNEYDYEQQDTQHEECDQEHNEQCNYNINSTPTIDIDIMGNEKNRPTDRVRHQGQPGELTDRVRHHGQQGEPTESDIKGNQRHRPKDFDTEGNQKRRPTEFDAKDKQMYGPLQGQPGEPTDRVRHHGQQGVPTEFDIMGNTRHRPTEFDIEGNQKNRPMESDTKSTNKVLISLNRHVKTYHTGYATPKPATTITARQEQRSQNHYSTSDVTQNDATTSTKDMTATQKATCHQDDRTTNTVTTSTEQQPAQKAMQPKAPCKYLARSREATTIRPTSSSETTPPNSADHTHNSTQHEHRDHDEPLRGTTKAPRTRTHNDRRQQQTAHEDTTADIDEIIEILSLLDNESQTQALMQLPPHLLKEATTRLQQIHEMRHRNQEQIKQANAHTRKLLAINNQNKKITRPAVGRRLLNNAITELQKASPAPLKKDDASTINAGNRIGHDTTRKEKTTNPGQGVAQDAPTTTHVAPNATTRTTPCDSDEEEIADITELLQQMQVHDLKRATKIIPPQLLQKAINRLPTRLSHRVQHQLQSIQSDSSSE